VLAVAALGLALGEVTTASAACHGNGSNFNSQTTWGKESSNVSTCDSLNDYFGTVTDLAADGWKVRVETQWINGNAGWVPTANTGGVLNYNYGDNNSSTSYRLVRADGLTASTGSNWGF
jgi:hypothetical protein